MDDDNKAQDGSDQGMAGGGMNTPQPPAGDENPPEGDQAGEDQDSQR